MPESTLGFPVSQTSGDPKRNRNSHLSKRTTMHPRFNPIPKHPITQLPNIELPDRPLTAGSEVCLETPVQPERERAGKTTLLS